MKTVKLSEFYGKTALEAVAQIDENALLATISGDISQISFPPISQTPQRKNELWTIGCFEIFVSGRANSYTEYNFGFDRCWQRFDFSDYRQNTTCPSAVPPPKITCEFSENRFTQKVEFNENIIGENPFSITAAVKLKNGEFLYFANKHCGEKPDFHLSAARQFFP